MAKANEQEGKVAEALDDLRRAITVVSAPGHDAAGGTVACLTEAVMGVTAGLVKIAEAIDGLSLSIEGCFKKDD